MSSESNSGLASLKEDDAPWFFGRVQRLLVRMSNQGVGAFLLYALMLTVAFVIFRLVFYINQRDQAFLADLLQLELEPQSHVTRGTVLALILQALDETEVASGLYCNGQTDGDCRFGPILVQRTEALLGLLTMARLQENAGAPLAPKTQNEDYGVQAEKLLRDVPNVAERFKDLVANGPFAGHADNASLKECPRGDEASHAEAMRRRHRFTLDSPFCSAGPPFISVQVVPEQVAGAVSLERPAAAPEGNRVSQRVKDALDAAGLFDLAVQSVVAELASTVEKQVDGPRLVAAYVISVDDIIRYWSRDRTAQLSDLPTYRQWAAQPYIETLLNTSGVGQSHTRAYIDFAGLGIMHTVCDALEVASDKTGQVAAVVCADYALSRNQVASLVRSLNEQPITTATAISFAPRGGGTWAVEADGKDYLPIGPFRAWLESLPGLWALDPAAKREIRPSPTDPLTYFVPTGVRSDGRMAGLLLQVRGVGPAGSIPTLMIAGLLALALAAVAYRAGAGSSKEVANREALLGRLRSLPVAVIQTDADDRITAGNDRAEELVGASLPTFGLQVASRKIWELFDESKIVYHLSDAHLTRDTDFSKLKIISWTQLRELRERGNYSTYYVRVLYPREHRWLRIHAGPIFQPHGGVDEAPRRRSDSDLLGTFGILEPLTVDGDLRTFLERTLDDVDFARPA